MIMGGYDNADDSGYREPDEIDECDADLLDDGELGNDTCSNGAIRYDDYVSNCPACGKPVSEDMDCCPYCGDILFRSLRDGTFVPRKGFWRKVFVAVVVTIIALGVLMFLLRVVL